jgi:uncharacterized membrane protein YjfL (UPF0719 family)
MTLLESMVIGLTRLILAIVLAVVALYVGFFTTNRIAIDLDIQSELAKANSAIGIFVASVFIGISITVYSCIQGIMMGLKKIFADGVLNLDDTRDIVFSSLESVLGILLAIGSIYLAVHVFSRISPRTDMINAMKNGNVAIAGMMAGMIIAVSVIIHAGVLGIITDLF